MKKQKLKMTGKVLFHVRQSGVGLLALVFIVGSLLAMPLALADQFQSQINELQAQNGQHQQALNALKVEANGLQATIAELQAQINGLQARINENQRISEELKVKIAEAEAELVKQKKLLGQNIRAMYLEGQISTLEMLASSKDLSEFVDKQQYRDAVKDKIKSMLDKITALKLQLKNQKTEVERLIKEQTTLKNQIASQKAEQDRLLGMNVAEQAATDREMKSNYSKIADLKRQQAIENARLFGSGGGQVGGGGYPWGNAPCLNGGHVQGWCSGYEWGYNGSYNNWATGGYAFRNCTDWVAYRVRVAGGYVPSGLGNAKSWDDRAPAYGYTVSGTPRVGAAAVSNAGFYGHVMYVEAVNGDGSIIISDYNRAGPGEYGMSTLSAGTAANLSYVYF